jgi:hypothetical protein
MNMKRMRGRNHRPNGGGGGGGGSGFRNQQNGIPLNRNHVFDSSGPEMRVRGTAQQLYDKYQQMARDASSNGDRVTGEAYYQHAEHYFRIISAINQAQGQPNQPAGQQQNSERVNYQPQQNNGQSPERGEYQRRDFNGNEQNELPIETRQEHRPQENRQHENRQQEPRQENRQEQPRLQEHRPQEQQPRRFEQRPYEPRPKPEFQRNDRNDRNERNEQRFRPEPVVDARIDISSALEAELAAATAELPGFGEQPAIPRAAAPAIQQPVALAPAPVAEPRRAIPIISNAPPAAAPAPAPVAPPAPAPAPAAAAPEAAAPEAAAPVKVAKPRGRPRLVKVVAEEAKD